jgi:hypothetical protein
MRAVVYTGVFLAGWLAGHLLAWWRDARRGCSGPQTPKDSRGR